MSIKDRKSYVRRSHVENARLSVATLWSSYTLRGMYRPPDQKQSVGCPDAALSELRKCQDRGKLAWLGWQSRTGWFVLVCEDMKKQRVSVAYMENACVLKMPET